MVMHGKSIPVFIVVSELQSNFKRQKFTIKSLQSKVLGKGFWSHRPGVCLNGFLQPLSRPNINQLQGPCLSANNRYPDE